MKTVAEIVKLLQNTSGNNDKIAILKTNSNNEMLKKVLYYTYNPLLTFKITESVFEKYSADKSKVRTNDFFGLLDILANSNINDGLRESVVSFVQSEDEDIQWLFKGVLVKDLRINMGAKNINKAFPKLIPEWEVQQSHPVDKVKKFKPNEWHCLALKMNGCFAPDTPILMADGTRKPIKEVEVGELVVSFDEKTRQLDNKRVIRKFDNGLKPKTEWVRLGILGQYKEGKRTIVTTRQHKFFTPTGWKMADDLTVGDTVYKHEYVFSQSQIEVLMGIGLGDANVLFDNPSVESVRFSYPKVNKDNYHLLCEDVGNLFEEYKGVTKESVSGYGSKMITQNIKTIKTLPKPFYNQDNILRVGYTFTEETVPFLSPLALAILYMDDGSMLRGKEDGADVSNIKSRATIATHRHHENNIDVLIAHLKERYGIDSKKKKHKQNSQQEGYGYQLELNTENSERFFSLVAPYIPHYLRNKKLPKVFSDAPFIDWSKEVGRYEMVEYQIDEKSSRGIDNKVNIRAYDLEIEDNHTYFANEIAVHNCRSTFYVDGFKSRQNQPMEGYQHIINDLETLCKHHGQDFRGWVFDGELIHKNRDYAIPDNENFRLTCSIVNSDAPEKPDIELVLFDMLSVTEFNTGESKHGYKQRLERLKRIQATIDKLGLENVRIAPVFYEGNGVDQEIIDHYLDWTSDMKLEGLMLIRDEKYKCKRHAGILKVKRFLFSDVRIIGYEEGEGKHAGRLGAFIINFKGNEVNVGSGYTDAEREEFWANRDSYIGQILEVKYKEETKNKKDNKISLQFPTFSRMRPDKDEESYES